MVSAEILVNPAEVAAAANEAEEAADQARSQDASGCLSGLEAGLPGSDAAAYDVLRVLGRPSTGQELVERQGRQFDRHRHADGGDSWFDVTGLRNPARRLRLVISMAGGRYRRRPAPSGASLV